MAWFRMMALAAAAMPGAAQAMDGVAVLPDVPALQDLRTPISDKRSTAPLFFDSTGSVSFGQTHPIGAGPWGSRLTMEAARTARPRLDGSAFDPQFRSRVRFSASQSFGSGALFFTLGAGQHGQRALTGSSQSIGRSRSIGLGWTSEDHWRLTLGWRVTSGGHAGSSGSRLEDLASGAPLHERGPRLSLAFADRSSPFAYGLTTSHGTLSARDATALRLVRSASDNRTSLFWLARF